jgi:hypothetical protein
MSQRRRELARAYRDTPRTAGIGVVRNTLNGKVLLVSGADIPALLNRHQAQLRLGAHRNAALQEDWRAAGAERFTFEVLDTLSPPESPGADQTDDLRTLEALWLDKLKPFAPAGYHPVPKAGR